MYAPSLAASVWLLLDCIYPYPFADAAPSAPGTKLMQKPTVRHRTPTTHAEGVPGHMAAGQHADIRPMLTYRGELAVGPRWQEKSTGTQQFGQKSAAA